MKRSVLLIGSVAIMVLTIAGIAFAAQISCMTGASECVGTEKSDDMQGTAGDDLMFGEGGADVMRGAGGSDAVKGKSGGDQIYGGAGNDKVKGGEGPDRVRGGVGDDVVRGGLHDRTNDGSPDILLCGPGKDEVYYTKGVDTIRNCEILHPSR